MLGLIGTHYAASLCRYFGIQPTFSPVHVSKAVSLRLTPYKHSHPNPGVFHTSKPPTFTSTRSGHATHLVDACPNALPTTLSLSLAPLPLPSAAVTISTPSASSSLLSSSAGSQPAKPLKTRFSSFSAETFLVKGFFSSSLACTALLNSSFNLLRLRCQSWWICCALTVSPRASSSRCV
jgi:hypothetical protein